MEIKRGKYINQLSHQLRLGHVTLPPHGSVTIDPDVQAAFNEARWKAMTAAILVSIERGYLKFVDDIPVDLRDGGLRIEDAPLEEDTEEAPDVNPYLKIDAADATAFLGQSYQTIKKQLRSIEDRALLGKLFAEAGRLGKSEAILRVIEQRMQELQPAAMAERERKKRQSVDELMPKKGE